MMRLSVFFPSAGIDMNVSSETRCDPVAAMRTSRRRVAALFGGFARDAFVADDHERVAGRGNVGKTHHLDGNRGASLLDLFALVVDERAHLAKRTADDDDVADAQRAVLHQHRRDGTASPRESADSITTPVARRFLFALSSLDVGFEQHGIEQRIDAGAGSWPRPEPFRCCRPSRPAATFFGKLLLDAIGLRIGLVHLVDRNDDRHARRPDVGDRFFGLRHDAVVGGDHEDGDVGDLGAARAHRRERFVTGRIDEGDLAIVSLDRIRTDLLRDAAGFAAGNVGAANLSSSEVLP
jgi:hypothetical protein